MALTVTIGLVQPSSWTNVPDGIIGYTISGGTGPYTVALYDISFNLIQQVVNPISSGSFTGLYSNQPNSNTKGSYYIAVIDSLGASNSYANILSTLTYISCNQTSSTFDIGGVMLPTCDVQQLVLPYFVDTTLTGYTLDVHLAIWDGIEGSALIDVDDFTTSSIPNIYYNTSYITNNLFSNINYVVYAIDTNTGNILYSGPGSIPTYYYANPFSEVTFKLSVNDPTDCNQSGSIHVFDISGGDGSSGYSISVDNGVNWLAVSNPSTGLTIGVPAGSSGTVIVKCGTYCFSSSQTYTVGTVPAITYSVNIVNAVSCTGNGSVQVSNISGGPGLPFYVSFNNGSTYTLVSNPIVGIFQSFSIGTSNKVIVKSGNCTTTPNAYYISGPTPWNSTITGPTTACLFKQYTLQAVPGGGTGPYTYQWKGGQNTSSITVSSSSVGNVTYSVVITDSLGCSSFATITVSYNICGTSYVGTFQGGPYTQTADMNCLTEAQISHIYETAINVCGCEDCSDNTKDTIN